MKTIQVLAIALLLSFGAGSLALAEPLSEFTVSDYASDFMSSPEGPDAHGAIMGSNPYGQFRAEGEHTCWHPSFIGNTCSVSGVGYTDCNHAFVALQQDNCCSRMMWQGRILTGATSNSFKITKCTRFR